MTLLAHRGVSVAQWLKRRSPASEGLRFDSSWGLRIFSLSHVRDKTNKNLSLHFDFFPVSQNKQVIFYSHYIKLILLVRSRQLDMSIVPFFCVFLNFDLSQSIKTQKRKKKELCQYPAILTSRLVNTHIYQKWIKRHQLIHVMASVCIDFLDSLNKGTVEFGLCELSRLLE